MMLELEVSDEVGKLVRYWAEFLRQTPEQYLSKLVEIRVPPIPNPPKRGALVAEIMSGKYPDPDDEPEESVRTIDSFPSRPRVREQHLAGDPG